jgi:hypothetical protein
MGCITCLDNSSPLLFFSLFAHILVYPSREERARGALHEMLLLPGLTTVMKCLLIYVFYVCVCMYACIHMLIVREGGDDNSIYFFVQMVLLTKQT